MATDKESHQTAATESRTENDRTATGTADQGRQHHVSRRRVLIGAGTTGALVLGAGTASANAPTEGANVTIGTQCTSGTHVTINRVFMSDGGYVSIHDTRRLHNIGGPERFDMNDPDLDPINASLIGITPLMEPGGYNDIEVPLLDTVDHGGTIPASPMSRDCGEYAFKQNAHGLAEGQPLFAIPHRNDPKTGDDFVTTDPAYREPEHNHTLGHDGLSIVHDIAAVHHEDDLQPHRSSVHQIVAEIRREFS